jgi:hypothetical protein
VSLDLLPRFIRDNYEVKEWRHACAILYQDFPKEWKQLCDVLERFRLYKTWITAGGGRKTALAAWIDAEFGKHGWVEKQFETSIEVDKKKKESPTHKVDCFKNKIALELEWNNKDPFFDRDLNNFRLLFDLHAVSVGIIITRCDDLQGLFKQLGRGRKYGSSTTHMGKLLPRIEGGGGAGCPLLVFGIKPALYSEGASPTITGKKLTEGPVSKDD